MEKDLNVTKIVHGLIYIVAIIVMLLNIFLDLPGVDKIPWNYWIVLSLLVIRIVMAETSIPSLYFHDCGSEPKRIVPGNNIYSLNKYSAVYVEICSKRATATEVFSSVMWKWTSGTNSFTYKSTGRWFIPDGDKKNSIINQQTVTIFPNGMPRRLHFGILGSQGTLCSFSRNQEGYDELFTFQGDPSEILVEITLRSENKGKCVGHFIVRNLGSGKLEIVPNNKRHSLSLFKKM